MIVTVKQRATPRKVEFDGSVVTVVLPTDAQREAIWRDNFVVGPKGSNAMFNSDGFSRDLCALCVTDITPFPDLDDVEAKFSKERIKDIMPLTLTQISNLIGDLGGQLLSGYKADGDGVWRPLPPVAEEKKDCGDGGERD